MTDDDRTPDPPLTLADLPPTTPTYHLLNLIKAGLATAPFTGGIASLMGDYIPNQKIKRLEAFAEQVGRDLAALQRRVDSSRILTDDYAFIFERCLRGVSDFPQKEKLAAFRGILLNSVLSSDLSQDQREYFLNLAERLSPLHLRMLRFMLDPKDYLSAMEIPETRIVGGFSQFFPVALPGVPLDVIRAAFSDLHGQGFTNTSGDIFSTMTAAKGLDLLADRLTPLGKGFALFCQAPPEVIHPERYAER